MKASWAMHRWRLAACALAMLMPTAGTAQDGRIDLADSGDTAWLLGAALIALLCPAGIALMNAGRVRSKNVVSVLIQCAVIFAAVSVLWIVLGYTLAFGAGSGGWLGNGNAWMLITLGNVRDATYIPESAYAVFEMAFAILAATLLTGAWAERARLGWVATFASLWSLVVYAPVAHWLWGNGWLARGVGTLDWSGGLVVHLSAGVSGLTVALMLGRRKGIVQGAVEASSSPLVVTGAMMSWLGALALSGGSALAANDDAAAALVATHAAAAAGALIWILAERLNTKRTTAIGLALGATAGLATASAAAGFISPGSAILLGMLGSLTCHLVLHVMRRWLLIDDALGVFAIHGVGGAVGCLLLAAFLSEGLGGTGYGEGMNPLAQLVAQAIGIMVVVAWSVGGSVILALMASLAFPMRVSEEAEFAGLDATYHQLR